VLKKILAYKSCHHTTFRCKNKTKINKRKKEDMKKYVKKNLMKKLKL